ncbi:Uncharacterized protein APZ42_007332 [Daphnia magna]|uniref:Uncharacterized protein n=1 Tax=Daphnia magna TaxID=35525 RepID=A0A164FCS8_9CRUS|nr:Uncharacterized protein APZ42_007332 [Daphnia magna]
MYVCDRSAVRCWAHNTKINGSILFETQNLFSFFFFMRMFC